MNFRITLQNGDKHTEEELGIIQAEDVGKALTQAKEKFGTPRAPCCLSVYPEGSKARLDVQRRKRRIENAQAALLKTAHKGGEKAKAAKEAKHMLRLVGHEINTFGGAYDGN